MGAVADDQTPTSYASSSPTHSEMSKKSAKLLSEIDNRPLSDAELREVVFCFQIAFYFLACLAITARIEDASLQKKSIDQLNDRIRAFYARSDVAGSVLRAHRISSRTRSIHCRSPPAARPTWRDPELTPLRRRQRCWHCLILSLHIAFANTSMQSATRIIHVNFTSSRNRSFFTMARKQYRPAAVAAIADLLAVNYNTVSAIVATGLRAVDAPQTEDEDALAPMPLTPRMPDVTEKRPSKIYLAGMYVLRLVEDVGPVGGGDIIRYRYVLAVCDRRESLPLCLVTLEDSSSISNVLGVFEHDGSHSNYGTLRGRNLQEFIGERPGPDQISV